ncbi:MULTISPECIES: DUF4239 domain-containing protein [unclassified Achromobacter]|uniref:bestrophin-like domain n=1 Tax=unclassified Achromobacter TaxID=2626865 RepID=UPI000B5192E2|nr:MULTISPECIES: DUF4239 domain-containing protein [unclassified Achromobacter]OWT74343.1 hypothetical protein CEY05_17065 [Achromobacter sp. HZ34]OWT78810.1 hypothetical protein CEY04_06985 [Achromobacter sp. HZ28]
MTHFLIALGVFALVLACTLFGMYLRKTQPAQHMQKPSMKAIQLATGLIATLAALVMGLLVSSSKHTLDTVNNELVHNAVNFLQLDRLLQAYGPEAQPLRHEIIRDYVEAVDLLATSRRDETALLAGQDRLHRLGDYQVRLMALPVGNDTQRQIRDEAVKLQGAIVATRWLVLMQREGTISTPLIVVLLLWLAVIFTAFGLQSPPNPAVICALVLCGVSAAGALFLIIEMGQPLDGLIHISLAPLQDAVARLQP